MENSFYVGISRQIALQSQMDLIANNVANVSTPGNRGQNLDISDDRLSMVQQYGQFQTTLQGPLQQTGNPLDVALSGPGYMGVQTAKGIQYTRAGNFQINASGT